MTKISDHAIVRYLERVKGLDIDEIRKEILPDYVRAKTKAMGNGYYPVNGTHKIRVKNDMVITVFTPKMGITKFDPTKNMTTRNKALRKAEKRRNKREQAAVRESESWEEAGLE